jgi:hypothetical protein
VWGTDSKAMNAKKTHSATTKAMFLVSFTVWHRL